MADFGGRYQKLDRLGWGGFGEVWLAEDPRLGNRKVAIKVMRPSVQDPVGLARFQRELALTAQMRHPNIVTVFDTGTDNGMPFMVMEYLDGNTVKERPAGAVNMAEAARIGRDTCVALAHAHGQDPPVVHRDIKPENIFLCRDGMVKVTDFGIAQAATGGRLTQTGYVIGTPGYMAPEVLLGELATPKSDIWAVGCVLYELISGKRPYEYTARGERIPPLTGMPGMPAWLGKAVMRMLQPYAGDRPTAAECVQLLAGPPARPPLPVVPGPLATPVPKPVTPPAPPLVRPQDPLPRPGRRAPGNPSSPVSRPPAGLPGSGASTPPRGATPTPAALRRRRLSRSLMAGVIVIAAAGGATAWFLSGGASWIPDTGTAYVTNGEDIVPVNLVTGQVGRPIAVGGSAYGIALSPQGDEAYAVDQTTCQGCSGTVGISSLLPVSLPGGSAGKPVPLDQGSLGSAGDAFQVVLSPDGRTAYVMTATGVIPVDITSGHKGATIKVGNAQSSIAISPSGRTLYVTASSGKDLFPVNVATGAIGSPVKVGRTILAIAVAPNGGSIYVYDAGGIASVNPTSGRINWQESSPELGTGGATLGGLVITPGAQEAYAGGAGTGVVPINLRTHQVEPILDVGQAITSMVMSQDGKVVYVTGLTAVYPISVADNQVGESVLIGSDLQDIAIAP